MVTRHEAKVLLIIPAARLAAVRAWITTNLDATGGGMWFGGALSATGGPPATHHAACFHATRAELAKWIGRLLTLVTDVADPRGQWDAWTRQERATWLALLRTALRQQQSIGLRLAWNDLGESPDFPAECVAGGITPIRGTLP